jgi:hypothetical protein
VDRFLRGEGFVVLGMNRGDASPGLPFEAWAYRGPLDFDAASPVVFGLGANPIEALNALTHQLAGVDEAQHRKERPDACPRVRSEQVRAGSAAPPTPSS